MLRRRVANAYSMSSILTYEEKIQRLLDACWIQFRYFAQAKKSLNMDSWSTYFAYDVVSELAMGRAFGMIKTGNDVGGFAKSVLGLFYLSQAVAHLPGQTWWLKNPLTARMFACLGRVNVKGQEQFKKFMVENVLRRYNSKEVAGEKDMLQHFIESKDRDGAPIPFDGVLLESSNVLG